MALGVEKIVSGALAFGIGKKSEPGGAGVVTRYPQLLSENAVAAAVLEIEENFCAIVASVCFKSVFSSILAT